MVEISDPITAVIVFAFLLVLTICCFGILRCYHVIRAKRRTVNQPTDNDPAPGDDLENGGRRRVRGVNRARQTSVVPGTVVAHDAAQHD